MTREEILSLLIKLPCQQFDQADRWLTCLKDTESVASVERGVFWYIDTKEDLESLLVLFDREEQVQKVLRELVVAEINRSVKSHDLVKCVSDEGTSLTSGKVYSVVTSRFDSCNGKQRFTVRDDEGAVCWYDATLFEKYEQ